jgi:cytolysin-activating lysine-acyltransferase
MSLATAKEDAAGRAAAGADANGSGKPPVAARPGARSRDVRQARFAQTFAQVVAVLMRDANFRKMRLADLEWLVLPPVMAGQFRLAQAPSPVGRAKGQEGGVLVPVAVALWARVSAEIDTRLSENLDKPLHLRPNEWASGDNVWLIAVAGDRRAVPKFIEELAKTEFKAQRVKMRLRGPDNKVVVKALGSVA